MYNEKLKEYFDGISRARFCEKYDIPYPTFDSIVSGRSTTRRSSKKIINEALIKFQDDKFALLQELLKI